MARSAEARKLLARYDEYLAAASRRHGRKVDFTPAEAQILGQILDQIDEKARLKRILAKPDELTLREQLALSAEIRLLAASIERMLRHIKVDMPVEPSQKSKKAAKAANTRWGMTS